MQLKLGEKTAELNRLGLSTDGQSRLTMTLGVDGYAHDLEILLNQDEATRFFTSLLECFAIDGEPLSHVQPGDKGG